MSWIIHNPLGYIRQPLRGEGTNKGECATLVQALVEEQQQPPMPVTKDWGQGAPVKGRPLIPGTVIAIFIHDVYTGQSGNGTAHAALYIRQSSEGIEVVHQFRSTRCEHIKGTLIRFGGGTLTDHKSGVSFKTGQPEDDADNYYVVERKRTTPPKF